MGITDLNNERNKRALVNDFMKAGWGLALPKDGSMTGGPVIYFCDIESAKLYVVGTIKNAVEILEGEMNQAAYSYEDVCNAVGSLIGDVSCGAWKLDDEVQNMFATGAVMYIAGTQSYAYMKNEGQPNAHFIVLRYLNHADNCHILRPNPLTTTAILTPEEIERHANMILEMDKMNHPGRFKSAQIIPFRIKSRHDI
jgi:hypothetical protein